MTSKGPLPRQQYPAPLDYAPTAYVSNITILGTFIASINLYCMQQSLTKGRQSVTMLLTAVLRWTRSSSAILWTQLCTEYLSRRIQPPITAPRRWERFAKRPSKEERSEVAKNAYTVSHRLAGFLNLNRNNCKDFHTSWLGSASKTSIPFIKSWHFKKSKGHKMSFGFLSKKLEPTSINLEYLYCVRVLCTCYLLD